jgi:tetratricopeptide (TPR) repeat protein
LKSALTYNKDNTEGSTLLNQLRNTGEELRNTGLILGLNNRLQDAVNKLTGAIMFNPEKADYHLQRGILYKRQRDFNSAIDDFLLGLEKMNHDEQKEPILFNNFQRQILLTYNEFAIQCFEKHFYDDAIVLLNKAIKIEKGEKGFYVNRGGKWPFIIKFEN